MNPEDIFRTEMDRAEKARALALKPAGEVEIEEMHRDYAELSRAYMSLLRQTVKITRTGDSTQRKLIRTQEELERERDRANRLLLNILPAAIASRMKGGDTLIADQYNYVSVLFADIVGFTELSARLQPEVVVDLLNEVFSLFDGLAERHGLEKIKTIGDMYMVVGGLPEPCEDGRVGETVEMGLEMITEVARFNTEQGGLEKFSILLERPLALRIGIHAGAVVAGVIGKRKFIYDLWGDTVNTASRMESHGVAGRIQVSEAVHGRLRGRFAFAERGPIFIKGKGEMRTYFVEG